MIYRILINYKVEVAEQVDQQASWRGQYEYLIVKICPSCCRRRVSSSWPLRSKIPMVYWPNMIRLVSSRTRPSTVSPSPVHIYRLQPGFNRRPLRKEVERVFYCRLRTGSTVIS
jgi:hypothetical protein